MDKCKRAAASPLSPLPSDCPAKSRITRPLRKKLRLDHISGRNPMIGLTPVVLSPTSQNTTWTWGGDVNTKKFVIGDVGSFSNPRDSGFHQRKQNFGSVQHVILKPAYRLANILVNDQPRSLLVPLTTKNPHVRVQNSTDKRGPATILSEDSTCNTKATSAKGFGQHSNGEDSMTESGLMLGIAVKEEAATISCVPLYDCTDAGLVFPHHGVSISPQTMSSTSEHGNCVTALCTDDKYHQYESQSESATHPQRKPVGCDRDTKNDTKRNIKALPEPAGASTNISVLQSAIPHGGNNWGAVFAQREKDPPSCQFGLALEKPTDSRCSDHKMDLHVYHTASSTDDDSVARSKKANDQSLYDLNNTKSGNSLHAKSSTDVPQNGPMPSGKTKEWSEVFHSSAVYRRSGLVYIEDASSSCDQLEVLTADEETKHANNVGENVNVERLKNEEKRGEMLETSINSTCLQTTFSDYRAVRSIAVKSESSMGGFRTDQGLVIGGTNGTETVNPELTAPAPILCGNHLGEENMEGLRSCMDTWAMDGVERFTNLSLNDSAKVDEHLNDYAGKWSLHSTSHIDGDKTEATLSSNSWPPLPMSPLSKNIKEVEQEPPHEDAVTCINAPICNIEAVFSVDAKKWNTGDEWTGEVLGEAKYCVKDDSTDSLLDGVHQVCKNETCNTKTNINFDRQPKVGFSSGENGDYFEDMPHFAVMTSDYDDHSKMNHGNCSTEYDNPMDTSIVQGKIGQSTPQPCQRECSVATETCGSYPKYTVLSPSTKSGTDQREVILSDTTEQLNQTQMSEDGMCMSGMYNTVSYFMQTKRTQMINSQHQAAGINSLSVRTVNQSIAQTATKETKPVGFTCQPHVIENRATDQMKTIQGHQKQYKNETVVQKFDLVSRTRGAPRHLRERRIEGLKRQLRVTERKVVRLRHRRKLEHAVVDKLLKLDL